MPVPQRGVPCHPAPEPAPCRGGAAPRGPQSVKRATFRVEIIARIEARGIQKDREHAVGHQLDWGPHVPPAGGAHRRASSIMKARPEPLCRPMATSAPAAFFAATRLRGIDPGSIEIDGPVRKGAIGRD